MSQEAMSGSFSPCIEWAGGCNKAGYGRRWNPSTKKLELAHREAWRENFGQIPEGMNVLHRCDNPPCVNPNHLFLGTHADNVADRDRKGRGNQPKGERHPMSKLCDQDVRDIRIASGHGSSTIDLSELYRVDPETIRRVINRRTWSHV